MASSKKTKSLKNVYERNSLQSPSMQLPLSREENHRNDIDRISNLPDDVLCQILSFLPIQDCVATTLLSKKWVDLWTQVPDLDFTHSDHHPLSKGRNCSWFLNYMFCVLLLYKPGLTIRKLTLNWKLFKREADARYLKILIGHAIRRNIKELTLCFQPPQPRVTLPGCLFTCKTLVCLTLVDKIFVDVPATSSLPCLKILELIGLVYANDDTLRRLLSACPVLEDLIVSAGNLVVLDINVPSLKRITVTRYNFRVCIDAARSKNKLLIKAPMLERIDFKGGNFWEFSIEDASNLSEAAIKPFHRWSGDQLFEFLKEISNVRVLSLAEYNCCFWLDRPSKITFSIPFHNLVHLNIECECENFHFLIVLLECADNLKTLVLRYMPNSPCGRLCDEALLENNIVPKCVSMSLKTLTFREVYYNNECECKFLRYIMKNAKFLQQMKIGIASHVIRRPFWRLNLSKYPRASTVCDLRFFVGSSNQEIHSQWLD